MALHWQHIEPFLHFSDILSASQINVPLYTFDVYVLDINHIQPAKLYL